MNRWFKLLVIPFLVLFLLAGGAMANNITIWDGNPSYQVISGDMEDNEAEPGMVQSQIWDLEAFILEGTILTMIGGYNFMEGENGWDSGDVFIALSRPTYGDINGTTSYETKENRDYGYDFAVNLSGLVYHLNDDSLLTTSYYSANEGSSPWRFSSGETNTSNVDVWKLVSDEVDAYVDTYSLLGWGGNEDHYGVSLNLSSLLGPNQEFYSHFTMQCGNDNLMGKGVAPVPEPATMLLLGTGLIGLAGASRKKFKK